MIFGSFLGLWDHCYVLLIVAGPIKLSFLYVHKLYLSISLNQSHPKSGPFLLFQPEFPAPLRRIIRCSRKLSCIFRLTLAQPEFPVPPTEFPVHQGIKVFFIPVRTLDASSFFSNRHSSLLLLRAGDFSLQPWEGSSGDWRGLSILRITRFHPRFFRSRAGKSKGNPFKSPVARSLSPDGIRRSPLSHSILMHPRTHIYHLVCNGRRNRKFSCLGLTSKPRFCPISQCG